MIIKNACFLLVFFCILIICHFFLVNTLVNGLVHAVYASNHSDDPAMGSVLYQGGTLPRNISFNAAFRYLIFIPSIKNALLELEICEIGIVGEYWNRNIVFNIINVIG